MEEQGTLYTVHQAIRATGAQKSGQTDLICEMNFLIKEQKLNKYVRSLLPGRGKVALSNCFLRNFQMNCNRSLVPLPFIMHIVELYG